MSDKQRKKTEELLGYQVVIFCEDSGVIPVFYPHPTDRTLNVAINFRQDYSNHGIEQE
ncbi:hypothetical protein [Sulfurimonas sp.]|uniref:hypothetical protein n=1 Tax=Sulfurimonas sp. TaxID=2022749 RepID=UPI0025E636B0|nr:hypothetical protein [Sulfurimonas sp.]MDD5157243.1 hypothetical protein [Sulfurimonas sp.]